VSGDEINDITTTSDTSEKNLLPQLLLQTSSAQAQTASAAALTAPHQNGLSAQTTPAAICAIVHASWAVAQASASACYGSRTNAKATMTTNAALFTMIAFIDVFPPFVVHLTRIGIIKTRTTTSDIQ